MTPAIISFTKTDVTERFMRYVQYDTQADPNAGKVNQPSSPGQIVLLQKLFNEMQMLEVSACELDSLGYVYGRLPSNRPELNLEPLTLLAHVDTAPDCSGKDVKPRLIRNYQGETITFPDNKELQLSPLDSPILNSCLGDDLIVASGQTLLGSDDKAGVAEIMTLLAVWQKYPELPRPEVRVCFTSDEEIGEGINGINFAKLSKRCLTLDGGDPAELEYECFDAWRFKINFTGVSAHPGTAFGKMINAISIAAEFVSALPKDERPESTKERQGFYHPINLSGDLEQASFTGIVRDFEAAKNLARLKLLTDRCLELEKQHPGLKIKTEFRQQYRNMHEILKSEEGFIDLCRQAINRSGLKSIEHPIRGGTDGALLSFEGFPCPNIGSGQSNIHSLKEWTSTGRLAKSVENILNICAIYTETARND